MQKVSKFQKIYIISLALFIFLIGFFTPTLVDVTLHLFFSIRLIEDGGLYTRWVEVMPPTIYLIYSIPVFLHKITNLSYYTCVNLFTISLSFYSICLTSNLFKGFEAEAKLKKLKNPILCGLFIIFFILPAYTFSTNDREILFAILCYPWIICSIFDIKKTKQVIFFASIGFMIKQYNLIYPLIFIIFSEKFNKNYFKNTLSKENFLLGFFIVLQFGLHLYFFPEYFTEILTILLISYKGVYGFGIYKLFYIIVISGIILFYFYQIQDCRIYIKKIILLLACGSACLILNGNPLYNFVHLYAPITLILLLIIFLHTDRSIRYTFSVLLNILAFIAFFNSLVIFDMANTEFIKVPSKKEIFYETQEKYTKKPFISLSVNNWAFINNGLDKKPMNMLAFDHLWMLPWLVNNLDDPNSEIVKKYLRKKFIEALNRSQEISILSYIGGNHSSIPSNLDLFRFFEKELNLSKEFKNFKKIRSINACTDQVKNDCKIDIWQRQ